MTRKKYLYIGCGVVVLALIGFGIYRQLKLNNKTLVAEVSEKQEVDGMIPVWLKTNKDIQAIQSDLNSLINYRYRHGCLTDTPDDTVQCEHYDLRYNQQRANLQDTVKRLQIQNKDPQAIATATANIKDIREDQSLQITLWDIRDNLYSSNGKNVDVYRDDKGMEYSVDPASNKVVQFAPAQGSADAYRVKPELTQTRLKQIGYQFLAKHVSDFEQIKNSSDFTYTETSKDGKQAAFQWVLKNKPQGEDMAPFVQVVISPAGDIMGFNDTRSLYE